MTSFAIENKNICVYPSSIPNMPVIYLNTFAKEEDQVYKALQDIGCPDYTLVAISNLEWDHDMAPWDIPPISKEDTPCTGGAGDYLRLLIEKIIPIAEQKILGTVLWRGLAGYSLAGLFAVYSLYHTKLFSRIASMYGSLLFPGIKEYIFSHEMKGIPKHLYFSIGDKECKTNNPYLKIVQKNTEEIEAFYRNKGIDTVFQLNSGNHYKNAVERTAAGIAWLLNR